MDRRTIRFYRLCREQSTVMKNPSQLALYLENIDDIQPSNKLNNRLLQKSCIIFKSWCFSFIRTCLFNYILDLSHCFFHPRTVYYTTCLLDSITDELQKTVRTTSRSPGWFFMRAFHLLVTVILIFLRMQMILVAKADDNLLRKIFFETFIGCSLILIFLPTLVARITLYVNTLEDDVYHTSGIVKKKSFRLIGIIANIQAITLGKGLATLDVPVHVGDLHDDSNLDDLFPKNIRNELFHTLNNFVSSILFERNSLDPILFPWLEEEQQRSSLSPSNWTSFEEDLRRELDALHDRPITSPILIWLTKLVYEQIPFVAITSGEEVRLSILGRLIHLMSKDEIIDQNDDENILFLVLAAIFSVWNLFRRMLLLQNIQASLEHSSRQLQKISRRICKDDQIKHVQKDSKLDCISEKALGRTGGRAKAYLQARTMVSALRKKIDSLSQNLWNCERVLCEPTVVGCLWNLPLDPLSSLEGTYASASDDVVRTENEVEELEISDSVNRAILAMLGSKDDLINADEEDMIASSLIPSQADISNLLLLLRNIRNLCGEGRVDPIVPLSQCFPNSSSSQSCSADEPATARRDQTKMNYHLKTEYSLDGQTSGGDGGHLNREDEGAELYTTFIPRAENRPRRQRAEEERRGADGAALLLAELRGTLRRKGKGTAADPEAVIKVRTLREEVPQCGDDENPAALKLETQLVSYLSDDEVDLPVVDESSAVNREDFSRFGESIGEAARVGFLNELFSKVSSSGLRLQGASSHYVGDEDSDSSEESSNDADIKRSD